MKQKSKKDRNVPNLRFPGFDMAWGKKSVGEMISIKSDKYNPDTDESEYLCIELESLSQGTGELLSTFSSKNQKSIKNVFRSGNVLFGKLRPYLRKFYLSDFDGVCSSEIWVMSSTIFNPSYLYSYIQSNRFLSLTEITSGSKMPRADWNLISASVIRYPIEHKEREKIGELFRLINNRIQTQSKIIENLESLMEGFSQKIFTQQLRFKNENGNDFPNWEKKNLGDIGQTFNGLSGKTKVDFGKGKPYIQYMQIFKGSKINPNECGFVKMEDSENQNKAQYGDVFFTISSETPNEIGTSSVLLDDVKELYLNSFCFGYRPNSINDLVPEFAQFLFRSDPIRRKITPLAQGSTRFNMSKKELIKLSFGIPCPEEQTKIANFLSSISEKVETEKKILAQHQQQKKYLLQNLFI